MDGKKKSGLLFFCLAVVCPVVAFAMVSWYQHTVQELPYFGRDYQIESGSQQQHFTVSGFRFPNESDAYTTLDSVKGKVWVANYFFSNCKTICPIIMPNLLHVQEAYKGNKDFKMVSFSVDPQRDTTGQLQWYAQQLGIDTRQWHLLTGNKVLLYRYARNDLFITASDGDGGPDDFIHSDKIVLLDRAGHIRGYYDGTDRKEIQSLIKDIKKLL